MKLAKFIGIKIPHLNGWHKKGHERMKTLKHMETHNMFKFEYIKFNKNILKKG